MERIKKTPDEIKKGLEACSITLKTNDCRNCPYYNLSGCAAKVMVDALALIQQIEAKDAEKAQRIAELEQELAAAKRERDAAVKDISRGSRCTVCKKFFKNNDGVGCTGGVYCIPNNFEWRGVCQEKREVQDGK